MLFDAHTKCKQTRSWVDTTWFGVKKDSSWEKETNNHISTITKQNGLRDDVRNDPPRQQVLQNPQNGQRTMQDFVSPNVQGDQTPIVRPTVAVNNFEIKLAMIQNSPFNGLPHEDPFGHMFRFLEYCPAFKI